MWLFRGSWGEWQPKHYWQATPPSLILQNSEAARVQACGQEGANNDIRRLLPQGQHQAKHHHRIANVLASQVFERELDVRYDLGVSVDKFAGEIDISLAEVHEGIPKCRRGIDHLLFAATLIPNVDSHLQRPVAPLAALVEAVCEGELPML